MANLFFHKVNISFFTHDMVYMKHTNFWQHLVSVHITFSAYCMSYSAKPQANRTKNRTQLTVAPGADVKVEDT